MLVMFFGSMVLQFERISSQPHLGSGHESEGSGHESETKAKRTFNPQVNRIRPHSFRRLSELPRRSAARLAAVARTPTTVTTTVLTTIEGEIHARNQLRAFLNG